MNATHATVDLDDAEGLLAADRDGLLRAASMAGAQVRATAAALDEGDSGSAAVRPAAAHRDLGGRPRQRRDGGLDARRRRWAARRPRRSSSRPRRRRGSARWTCWSSRGDDPGDPALVSRGRDRVCAAVRASPSSRRTKARCATPPRAGRLSLEPRLWVPDDFGLARYLAAGLAVLQVVDPGLRMDLAALADELDAEALRNSAGTRTVHQPRQDAGRTDVGTRRRAGRRQRGARWRWPVTARRSCCGSRTRRWPRSDWPTRWWRLHGAWATRVRRRSRDVDVP